LYGRVCIIVGDPVAKYARDDTTPIPRPSTYYGREHYHDVREENAGLVRQPARKAAQRPPSAEQQQARHSHAQLADGAAAQHVANPPLLLSPQAPPGQIDKSALPLREPKRIRDKEHLKFVARQPCLVCGRQPSDAHHLRFAQPRAASAGSPRIATVEDFDGKTLSVDALTTG
jgi:hypothetical protein